MNDLKKRIIGLENTITKLTKNLKQIEDVKNKKELYNFSTKQLMKWLRENEVEFNENIKDTLINIVWSNLNEWEWLYYDDSDDEESEEEELDKESEEEELDEEKSKSESISD